MKIIKRLGVAASVLLLSAGVQVSQAQTTINSNGQFRVAMVNVQQVLQQSPRVANLSKKLEGQFKTRQAKINDEQKALQVQLDKLKKEEPTMSQKDLQSLKKKIADSRSELVKQVVSYQQDLQKEQNRIMQNILKDLNGIVGHIASNQNYALVLDAQAVIYATNGNDITKEVAKEFNDKNE